MKRFLGLVITLGMVLSLWTVQVSASEPLNEPIIGNLFMVNGSYNVTPASEILELNPTTGAVLNTIPTPVATDGGGDGLAYGNGRMFFSVINTRTIYEIDPSDGSVVNSFSVATSGDGPDALGFDGQKLYALEYGGEPIIHVLNPDTGATVTTLLPTVSLAGGGTFAGTRNSLFFTGSSESGEVIFEIDPTTGAVINSFSAPGEYSFDIYGLFGLGFSSSRNALFAGYYDANLIYELDPDDGTIINSFAGPEGAAISALAADEARPICSAILSSMAAPNITEIILEAEGIEANQSFGKGNDKTFINLTQLTAAYMGPQTDFDGVSKYLLVGEPGEEIQSLNPDYWQVVLDFLNSSIEYYGLTIGPLTYSYADYVADLNGGTEPTEPGVLFEEDFTGVDILEIPAGWFETAAYPNWHVADTAGAGGTSPEMIFDWWPHFDGTSRLITPAIDASTNSNLQLTFDHFVDHYGDTAQCVLKVQLSTDGGSNWEDAWSISPTGDIGPETVMVDLSSCDGQTFQIAWVFVGDSWFIDFWHIDDILVTGN